MLIRTDSLKFFHGPIVFKCSIDLLGRIRYMRRTVEMCVSDETLRVVRVHWLNQKQSKLANEKTITLVKLLNDKICWSEPRLLTIMG